MLICAFRFSLGRLIEDADRVISPSKILVHIREELDSGKWSPVVATILESVLVKKCLHENASSCK